MEDEDVERAALAVNIRYDKMKTQGGGLVGVEDYSIMVEEETEKVTQDATAKDTLAVRQAAARLRKERRERKVS